MESNLDRLMALTDKLEARDFKARERDKLLRDVSDNIEIAVWAKDIDNRFVYANKVCCDLILHCSEADAISFTDTDFAENKLAWACKESDNRVQEMRSPMRFIEHNGLWWDVLKSPWFRNDILFGTVGTGRNITGIVPSEIKEKFSEPGTVVIPVDTELCREQIVELMNG